MRARRLPWLLTGQSSVVLLLILIAFTAAIPAAAGPNAGGTLVIHDPELAYSAGSDSYPSDPPSTCPDGIDAEIPPGGPEAGRDGWVWKVYAAFPTASSPRLKALVMGEEFDCVVLAGGSPDPVTDFEIPQDGWPTSSGGGTGLSFLLPKTDVINEVYWFGGYGYNGGEYFAMAPHPTQPMMFVDDAAPPHEDPIVGLSSIGFGFGGSVVCPPPLGACCHCPDGTCELRLEVECTGIEHEWHGVETPCDPNPCVCPQGSCCHPDGTCNVTWQGGCLPPGTWTLGGSCDPNPCPPPPRGACCYLDGHCESLFQADCPTGDWREGLGCIPNPCPYENVNAGGVLVVHYTGLVYTTDIAEYPSDPPASCDAVLDAAPPDAPVVWKVYAAFPETNSPRLKALRFGEGFDPDLVHVLAGGLPDPVADFEVPQDGWPTTPGGCVGISFGEVQTAHIVEVYWLGGYGARGGIWATAQYPGGTAEFADDSIPVHLDPIAGLGSLGFGTAGDTPCGEPHPEGACCYPDGTCYVMPQSACTGAWILGGTCAPNPCQPISGACCHCPESTCVMVPEADCIGSEYEWHGPDVPCDPNPCVCALGSCCYPDGTCTLTFQGGCPPPGEWTAFGVCEPNPCVPPTGACCFADGSCQILTEDACSDASGVWQGTDTACVPNPCVPAPGACCFADGTCEDLVRDVCESAGGCWQGPGTTCAGIVCSGGPATGACCFHADGSCRILTEADCQIDGGDWMGVETTCEPNPCVITPVERWSWGQIKARYR